MRWLHVYTSMIAFVVILFFGVTGLLVNNPSWLGGNDVTVTTVEGTLPSSLVSEDGSVEFLAVSQYIRDEHGVVGEVSSFDQADGGGSINYDGPGYGAAVRFDLTSLDYDVLVREEGFTNAMRDLHSGNDSGSLWSVMIDLSAVFLILVSVSGLGIQIFLRKRRGKALSWLAVGTVLTVVAIWWAMV